MNLLLAATTPGAPALDAAALAGWLAQLPGWALHEGALQRRFAFHGFRAVMAFANAVAELAEAQDHHPELVLGPEAATVRWRTHSAGGALSLNDVILAAQVSALPEAHP